MEQLLVLLILTSEVVLGHQCYYENYEVLGLFWSTLVSEAVRV